MQGSDFYLDADDPSLPPTGRAPRRPTGIWGAGDRVTWVAGLILALSTFMGWYAGSGVGVKLAVIGWHTGTIGKLVFFIGLATVSIVALREAGIELPASTPESVVILALTCPSQSSRARSQ